MTPGAPELFIKLFPEDADKELTHTSQCHGTYSPLGWPHFPHLGTWAGTSSTCGKKVSLVEKEPPSLGSQDTEDVSAHIFFICH